jgi:hypothetical protein
VDAWVADSSRDISLLADNAHMAARLRRLGLALAEMAHELACARRENASLRSENARLSDLLGAPRDT